MPELKMGPAGQKISSDKIRGTFSARTIEFYALPSPSQHYQFEFLTLPSHPNSFCLLSYKYKCKICCLCHRKSLKPLSFTSTFCSLSVFIETLLKGCSYSHINSFKINIRPICISKDSLWILKWCIEKTPLRTTELTAK